MGRGYQRGVIEDCLKYTKKQTAANCEDTWIRVSGQNRADLKEKERGTFSRQARRARRASLPGGPLRSRRAWGRLPRKPGALSFPAHSLFFLLEKMKEILFMKGS